MSAHLHPKSALSLRRNRCSNSPKSAQWPGLPDPAELSRQARAKNALFVIEHGLPSAIETHNADNPSRRVDAVHAFQINLPLRIAHPNGKTTTVSLIKGEPDQAEWDRIKSLVPADLPVLTEGQ